MLINPEIKKIFGLLPFFYFKIYENITLKKLHNSTDVLETSFRDRISIVSADWRLRASAIFLLLNAE